jgi:DNA-binding CsgD family transcriptional regulator
MGPGDRQAWVRGPSDAASLIGRANECRHVERLLEAAKGGHSGVLVVRGEPGIGKSALLEHAVRSAAGFQVVRASGVESEMEFPFAGLHQLCVPMLDRLALLPAPQREAMSTAFGLADGRPPDRFLIGLALLTLLAGASERAPLLCIVDDTQWVDRASSQALAFVARRLLADRVGVVFATREPSEDLKGLPELAVEGLGEKDARSLLDSALRVPLDPRVCDRIVAEAHGNPLALVEWPRGMTPDLHQASWFGLPALLPLSGRLEESFRRRLADLPSPTRRFLTVAAAEPTGDPVLVWRAAARLGVGSQDAWPAIEAGLIDIGARVSFRHPLVRSVAYRDAGLADRQAAHGALAEATDPVTDSDRRAWHRAEATSGPEESVAEELERAAGRAQARGGLAAAAALLERSAALTLDPARRAQRTIAAASAHVEAGGFEAAAALLATAEAGPLDELSRARIELVRGYSAHALGDSGDAASLLLNAARHLEGLDTRLARDAYMGALGAANFAATDSTGATQQEIAMAARAAPPTPPPHGPLDLLLAGFALVWTDGPAAAAPALREAIAQFRRGPGPDADELRWFGYPVGAASLLWDYASQYEFSALEVDAARALGALRMLPWALENLGMAKILGGDLSTAASLIGEAEAVSEATGNRSTLFGGAQLAGWRGREAEAVPLIVATIAHARAQGEGMVVKFAQSASATLYNGLGRYEQSLGAAEEALRPPHHRGSHWTLHELVEAASRSGQPSVAAAALEQLSDSAQAGASDWALGIEARSRALLRHDDTAEDFYLEAIERLDSSPIRPEAARAHLLYGEWLRRDNRRVEARDQLRDAYDQLSAIGMDAFAERARRELAATGETVRRRSVETLRELTPQELQIARLVSEGLTNPAIGTQMFISARTVEYHLRKVFTKLDVTSRKDLRVKIHKSRELSSAK